MPPRVRDVFRQWSDEFAGLVWPRFQVLVFAAIVCVGRHTICRQQRIAGVLAEGHWSTRLLAWSLAQRVVDWFVSDEAITVIGDDTVAQHPG